jgi:uncharacterized protein YndB with AHSA1/START domain
MNEIIKKSIEINVSKEKVWDVLQHDNYTKIWYLEFSPETISEVDWREGGRFKFLDGKGNGMAGKVSVYKPNEKVTLEFDRVIANDKEDFDSDSAKKWIGGTESYSLSQNNNITNLTVRLTGPEEFGDMFNPMWDKALLKIKELSEGK